MFLVQACSYKNKIDSNYYCQKLKLSCIQSNKIVNFKTTKGDFEVELFGKDNPVTVSNFLENIDNDIYVNQKFYKIIIYPQIKFIHGGVNPKNKLYFDLWIGAIITTDYMIHHKFSFFDSDKFNRFYVTNKPKSINMISIGYVQNGSHN